MNKRPRRSTRRDINRRRDISGKYTNADDFYIAYYRSRWDTTRFADGGFRIDDYDLQAPHRNVGWIGWKESDRRADVPTQPKNR